MSLGLAGGRRGGGCGGGVSEFHLLHRLGLFFFLREGGGVKSLNFTIFGVLVICRCLFGVTFKTEYFFWVYQNSWYFFSIQ